MKTKIWRKKFISLFLTAVMLVGVFSAAGVRAEEEEIESSDLPASEGTAPEIPGLTFEKQTDFVYAEAVDIYYYEGGYKFYDLYNSARYLQVPEGAPVPEGLDSDVIILQEPLNNIYLAATAIMALFNAIDSLDAIRLAGLQADGWYIEEASSAMNEGKILFAGKYSEPDYELLINEDCRIAIESTMILHTPKVQEMIENMGIPVFIDRSSYETHPLARTEWVKVYGAMLGKEAEAEAFFNEQNKVIDELEDFPNTEKTVGFFFVNTDGSVVVRRSNDYVPKMIEIAGGRYVLENVDFGDTKRSSVPMTMEEFYANAVDADYLIYNATIDAPIYSIDDLLAKDVLFAEFKAVKEGNLWCADKYLYQATDIVGNLIRDFNHMLTDGDEDQMTFLRKID